MLHCKIQQRMCFATQNRQVHIIYHCFRLAEARKDDKKEKLARPISLWCLIQIQNMSPSVFATTVTVQNQNRNPPVFATSTVASLIVSLKLKADSLSLSFSQNVCVAGLDIVVFVLFIYYFSLVCYASKLASLLFSIWSKGKKLFN